MTTVKTQAAQLWFETPPTPASSSRLFCTFAAPFNTASDMSDLLPREQGWPADRPPRALHYLVSCLTETGAPGVPDEQRIRQNWHSWLDTEAKNIWSGATNARLYHPDANATVDSERRAFQFVKVSTTTRATATCNRSRAAWTNACHRSFLASTTLRWLAIGYAPA